jgi:1-acyl-sn-glycerol-3-phosphate acyltransferase
MIRATRSLLFSLIYPIYLVVVMGTCQELVIRPLCALFPERRSGIVRGWLRTHAYVVLGMAEHIGGLKIHVRGVLPETAIIVLMNHQSLFDIPVGVRMVRGPYPIIPTRDKYTSGVPIISSLARLAGFPSLSQGERATKGELKAMVAAADQVAAGERSFLIFPEGHRSRDGELQPFMTPGLHLLFRRAQNRPVYLLVVDGLWRMRGIKDIALHIGDHQPCVEVLGPYDIPADPREHEAFIASLRDTMAAALSRLRAAEPDPVALVRPSHAG